jgi:hypothetical protein
MVEGQTSRVDLWIEVEKSMPDLKRMLEEHLVKAAKDAEARAGHNLKTTPFGTTVVESRTVLIGKKMFAELTGSPTDFEITPAGSQERIFREGVTFKWLWDVKPKKASKEGLPLTLKVTADPGDGGLPLEPMREIVMVKAAPQTIRQRIEAFEWWVKLLTGGSLAALIAAIWAWIRSREKSRRAGHSTS